MENKFKSIINFLDNKDIVTIKKDLLNILQYNIYCPSQFTAGNNRRVYIPEINNTIPYKINNKIINIPIVIKESVPNNPIQLEIINNILFITSVENMLTELLILIYIHKIISKTVNLLFLLGYSICNTQNNILIRIITAKQGLPNDIKINLNNKVFNESPLWLPYNFNNLTFNRSLATLNDLFAYIHYMKKKDDTILLPNGITCNIIELYDSLCISYLATYHLLTENNIFISDSHRSNIFIHWINNNSYYKNKSIKNIKYIVYKINNKYYKIKTFGIILIIGDVGTSIIKIRDDIILIGNMYDIHTNYNKLNYIMRPTHNNYIFLHYAKELLSFKYFMSTISYQIFMSEPYVSYPHLGYMWFVSQNNDFLLGWDKQFLNKLKSTPELLSFYDNKYGIQQYKDNSNSILIICKKY